MLQETKKSLPASIHLFPGIEEAVYFQHPETGEHWFQAASVCRVMGFTNTVSALSLHCDEDEKLLEVIAGRQTWFISEAGIYGLAMGAKSDIAKNFKRWLKHDVLPKLRANGTYSVTPVSTSSLTLPSTELAVIQREIELLKKESRTQRRHFITRLDWLCGMAEVKEMPDRIRVGFHASVPLAGYLTDLGFEVLSGEELKDTFAKKHHWFDDSSSIRIAVNEYYN